jgi:alpha-tubulin suppressor-like RCC1 family protein
VRRPWLPILVALVLTGGCEEDLTQIMVVVGTDVPALEGVRIEWSGLGNPGSRDIDFSSGRPALLPLVHRGGSLGPLTITAQGVVEGAAVMPVRAAEVSFVPGEVRMLRLDLLRSCVSAACSPLTCVGDGRCVPIGSADAATLLPWDGDPGDVDGGVPLVDGGDSDLGPVDLSTPDGCPGTVEICNGVDDDCDGVIDNGFDLSSDPANCGECGVSCASCVDRICEGTFVALAAGDAHTCATDDSGAVFCWGANSEGQLGDGTTDRSPSPVAVVGLPSSPAVQLAAGEAFSCARLASGEVWCWGRDGEGQRGDGPGGGGSAPSRVAFPVGGVATDLVLGAAHACAIHADEVYCWGANDAGQIGSGSAAATVPTPEPVTLDEPVDLAAGAAHSCAVLSDGDAQCWGSGSDSQLGVSVPSSDTPVTVNRPGGVTFLAVEGGGLFTCALTTVGAHCWGRGGDGALGYGATMTSAVPREVRRIGEGDPSDLPAAVSLDAGESHVCAVLTDGRLGCWGSDVDDQLGDPDTLDRANEPVVTGAIDTAILVAAGGSHTCARLVDGDLRCWGANGEGQLGTGDRDGSSVPVVVLPLAP